MAENNNHVEVIEQQEELKFLMTITTDEYKDLVERAARGECRCELLEEKFKSEQFAKWKLESEIKELKAENDELKKEVAHLLNNNERHLARACDGVECVPCSDNAQSPFAPSECVGSDEEVSNAE